MIHHAQHFFALDDAPLQGLLARNVDQREADQQRQQSLAGRDQHDQAEHDQDGPHHVLDHQHRVAQRRMRMRQGSSRLCFCAK